MSTGCGTITATLLALILTLAHVSFAACICNDLERPTCCHQTGDPCEDRECFLISSLDLEPFVSDDESPEIAIYHAVSDLPQSRSHPRWAGLSMVSPTALPPPGVGHYCSIIQVWRI